LGILQEFREFAVKGNVVDLAVGVIIGAAFGKIVTSLVSDVIMPPIGLAVGGVNFTQLALTLKEGEPPVLLKYGVFFQTVFDFIIVAIAVFAMVKGINRLKREEEPKAPAAPPPPPRQEALLEEIRDALRQMSKADAPR
jgi:large conductance mechanosensitive channel